MADKATISLNAEAQILGTRADTSSNAADATAMNLLRHIDAAVGGAAETLQFSQSTAPLVDAAGGIQRFTVSIVDRVSGPLASGSIDISTATISLAKSTGGGAFSTAGITQPTLSKAAGEVFVSYDFNAAQWAAGDSYLLTPSGVKATDSTGVAQNVIIDPWFNRVGTDATLSAAVGANTDAATDPSAASGTLFSKLRGAGDNLDTIITATDTLETATGAVAGAAVYVKDTSTGLIPYVKALLDGQNLVFGTVTTQTSTTAFSASGLGAFASSAFGGCTLEWLTGSNTQYPSIITSFTTGTGAIVVRNALPNAPIVGDTFVINVSTKQGILQLVPTADATTNVAMVDVIGQKTDTALTTIGTTASTMRYTKGILSLLTLGASEADFSLANNLTEQEVYADATLKGYVQGYLDLTNATTSKTIKVYMRNNANSAWVQAFTFAWDITMSDMYYTDTFLTNRGIRITLTNAVGEAITVPRRITNDLRA